MKEYIILFGFILSLVQALPPPVPDRNGHMIEIGQPVTREVRTKKAMQLTHKYINQLGQEHPTKKDGYFDISATPDCNKTALTKAVAVLKKVFRNMPKSVFETLARDAKVGIFGEEDGITSFKEFSMHKDRPECRGICSAACSDTCTGDGRKYDSLDGLAGNLAAVVDDNLLCNADDPYRGLSNILVHEFAHTIHMYGLPAAKQDQIVAAHEKAKKAGKWKKDSYAMSNEYEYFAEGSGVFFNVNKYSDANGGMSSCNDSGACPSEAASRRRLKSLDPDLYKILAYTYTNSRPYLRGGLQICV